MIPPRLRYPRALSLAFSLAETVVTVALCAIFFYITAVVFNNCYRILRQERYKVATQQGVQLALNRIVSELREAKAVTAVGNPLIFTKVDSSLNRFQSAFNFNQQLTVTYSFAGTLLTRQVSPGGSPQAMAEQMAGFDTANLPSGNIQVKLTFLDQRQLRVYDSEVAVPSRW